MVELLTVVGEALEREMEGCHECQLSSLQYAAKMEARRHGSTRAEA